MGAAPTGEAHDVVVLGAGAAGLMAAWQASLGGHDVVVLDRAERVGGMAASFEVAGQRVDLGSHRLHTSTSPRVLDALTDLLGDDLCVRTRNGRIALGGRFVAFPLSLTDLLANLPRRMAISMAMDSVTSPVRRPRDDSFAEVIRSGLGRTILDSFYGPYARKLWDVDARDLSGELARRRVSAGSPIDIAKRLLGSDGDEKRSFLYPRHGFGQIVEALAAAATDAGACIETGATVDGVEPLPGGVRLSLAGGRSMTASTLLSTIPITALDSLVGGGRDPDGAGGVSPLRYRGMRLVYLVLDRSRYTPFDAHYLPSPDTVASRLSEPKNYRDGDDPADRTVLCLEVPCTRGDSLWTRSDESLGEQLAVEIEALGLPRIEQSAVTSVSLPNVYPIYERGFERALDRAEASIESLSSVVSFGRAGLFTPDNTHHTLEMGWQAAECLVSGGGFDRERWVEARDSFRANIVED